MRQGRIMQWVKEDWYLASISKEGLKEQKEEEKRKEGNENEKKDKNTAIKKNEQEGTCVCKKVSKALCGWTQQVSKMVLYRIVPSVQSLVGSIKKENVEENHSYY